MKPMPQNNLANPILPCPTVLIFIQLLNKVTVKVNFETFVSDVAPLPE